MLRQHTTPAWIYLGAFALALIAGLVNAVGFLGVFHQALSHLTGTLTVLGMELARGDYPVALHALAILLAFFAGCVLSGAVIAQGQLKLGRRYGVALALESNAVFAAGLVLVGQQVQRDPAQGLGRGQGQRAERDPRGEAGPGAMHLAPRPRAAVSRSLLGPVTSTSM